MNKLSDAISIALSHRLDDIKTKKAIDYLTREIQSDLFSAMYSDEIKTQILCVLGYFYGKRYNYKESVKWLHRLQKTQSNIYMYETWHLFCKTLFPLFPNNQQEEHNIIQELTNNMDAILQKPRLYMSNILALNQSFYFAYIDTNPKTLYERYAQIQIKAFPSVYNRNLVTYTKPDTANKKPITLGVISEGLIPRQFVNQHSIHSSSISDSFYPTLLGLPKDKFKVIFIYYGKENNKSQSTNNNSDIYISNLQPLPESIRCAQDKIASLNLDMLLFLDMHIESSLNWIGLSKLARIQMCTHGHPVTSGIPRHIMNYFISWERAETKRAQDYYTETLALIPKDHVWEHFVPRNSVEKKSMLTGQYWGDITRERLKDVVSEILDTESHWYFCAQASFKLNYQFDQIISSILQKDPKAQIILIKNESQLYSMHSQYKNRLVSNKIDISRIVFVEKMKQTRSLCALSQTRSIYTLSQT